MEKYKLLIDGKWLDPQNGEWFETENPYTGTAWALIPKGGKPEIDAAVAAAKAAFHPKSPWRTMTASARGAILRNLGDLIARNADHLATIETRDNGKLYAEMRGQLGYIPQWYYYFGGLADKIEGRVIPIDKPGVFNFTREEPLGVIAAITPWNSPLCWPPGSWRQRSPPETRLYGSPLSSPRHLRSKWAGCSKRLDSRPA